MSDLTLLAIEPSQLIINVDDRKLILGIAVPGTIPGPKDAFFSPLSVNILADGAHVGMDIPANGSGNIEFRVPSDFDTLLAADILLIPGATDGTANIATSSQYAAVGEVKAFHSETNLTASFSLTVDTIDSLDVSSILSNISANDIGGILIAFTGVTDGATVLGLRLRYT